ncbi:MAG: xanthine dehydrogenase family protein subunit M [Ignavibacteria bacterium]|jgi:xanthine dehydrogenase YagS FAD-binding subunit
MIDFEYIKPETIEEASDILLEESESILPFSGGTDILGLIKDQVVKPKKLVNLKSIKGYDSIEFKTGEGLRIGSLVKIVEIAENKLIKNHYPILSEAANEIASPQLRNMGTLGGNLCQRPRCFYFRQDFDCIRRGGDTCYAFDGNNKYHCIIGGGPCFIVHPSDMAVALLALDAKISIYSNGNIRTIPLSEFFVLPDEDDMNENILKPGEIVTEVIVPYASSTVRSSYTKIKERGAWDFAIVSIGSVIEINNNVIKKGRIAFGGVAPKPWIDENLNKHLAGLKLNETPIETVAANVLIDANALEKNKYKIILARNLVRKVLQELKD